THDFNRCRLFHRRLIAGGRADTLRRDYLIVAVALDGGLHLVAVEGDFAVGAVARPRVDHVRDAVGIDSVAAGQRDGVAAVEIFRATGERRDQDRERDLGRKFTDWLHRNPLAANRAYGR